MIDPRPDRGPHRPQAAPHEPQLFAWLGGGIVLFGEQCDGRWIVARGWLQADRLTDVRRWSFAEPRAFTGQIRRLAWEATGNPGDAQTAAAAAAAWTGDGRRRTGDGRREDEGA